MDNKNKSFHLDYFNPIEKRKWYQFRKMDRREFGYTAILGLLAGAVLGNNIIGGALGFAGLVSAICWIILTIKHIFFEPRITTLASSTIGLDEIRKFIGEEANNLTDEEVRERFMKLPAEKQMEAFFAKKSEK